MRKALSVLLALSMLLSLCVVPSFAEEAIDEPVFVEEASADDEITQEEVAEDEVELMDGEAGDELEDEVTEPEATEPGVYDPSEYIESAVEGSKNGSYPASNLYDADNYGTIWHSATGNSGTSETALANKTVTFTFKKEMTIGGVRIYARKDLGGTPSAIIVTGIYADGSEAMLYSGPTGQFAKYFDETANDGKGRYWAEEDAHADVYFSPTVTDGVINKVSGLKFTVVEVYDGAHNTGTTGFTAFAGLQFLMPGEDEDYYTGPAFEAGEIPVVHSFPSYPAFTVETWRSDGGSLSAEYGKNPNVVLTDFNYNSVNAASSYHANTALVKDADGKVTATFNLAMKSDIPLTFSGIRVYLRTTTKADGTYQSWNNGNANQPTTEGKIYFSADNGATWEEADLVAPAKPTGDGFTQDMYVSRNGVPYDIKGNSIRLEITNGGTAWSASEVRFLAARGNAVIDAGAFEEIKANNEEVVALKETIESFASFESYEENAETIAEAREAYNALSDTEKYVMQYEFENNYLEALLDAEAMIVVEKINALSSLDQVPGNVAVIDEVRGIYDNLDDDVKAVVIEKGGLAALEAIEAKKSTFIFEAGDFSVPDGASITFANTEGSTASTGNLVDEKLTTHNEISISPTFANGGNAWVIINLGKEVTFSGVRAYSRRNPNDTSVSWTTSFFQSITMGNIFVSDNGEDWIKADTVGSDHDNFEHSFDLPAIFGGVTYNIKAQYIKVKTDNCAGGNHWAISEIRLLQPIEDAKEFTPAEMAHITNEADFSVDITDKTTVNDQVITLSCAATEVKSVVLDAGTIHEKTLVSGTDYELSDSTVTLKAAHIKELLLGMHIYTVVFKDGMGSQIKMTVADSTQILYNYVGVNGEGTLTVVLTNVLGKAVEKAVVNGTEVTVTNPADTAKITIGRSVFKKTGLYYENLGMADGDVYAVPVEVTFEDGSVVTYKVVIAAPWTPMPTTYSASGSATNTSLTVFSDLNFTDDEITVPENSGWRVRTDSARSGNHPVYAFTGFGKDIMGTADMKQKTAWHTWHGDGTFDVPASPNNIRFIDLDLGEDAPTIGGFRYYPRQNDAGTAVDNAWGKVVILGKNSDKDEWVELYNGTTVANSVDGAYKKNMLFDKNTTYRYYRIKIQANHCNALKIRILKPATKIVGNCAFDKGFLDMREDLAVSYETYPEGQTVTKVTIGEEDLEASEYKVTDDAVIIYKDTLAALSVGDHTVKLTIGDADYSTKLTVTDSSSAEFKFIYLNGASLARTENIVLTNVLGKTVTSVKDKASGAAITFAADTETITITRSNFRKAFDAYAQMGLNGGSNELSVTFDDSTVLTYTINMTGQWFTTADVQTPYNPTTKDTVADDEIPITENFKVRTDSIWQTSRKWAHPINAFYYEESEEYTVGARYHADTDEGTKHYIDVDLGEKVTLGGIRYIARYDGDPPKLEPCWATVKIYGSNNFEEWEELYVGGSATKQRTNEFYFNRSANVQYIRIYVVGTVSHANANALRLLKPVTKAIVSEADFEVGDATLPEYTFELTGEDSITAVAVKDGDALALDTDYTVTTEGTIATLTLKEDYLKTLDAGNSFLADLRQGKAYTYTVTVGEKTFDVTLNYVNSLVEKYVITTLANSTAVGNGGAAQLGTGHLVVKNFHTDKEVSKVYASFDSEFTNAVEVVDITIGSETYPVIAAAAEEIQIGRTPLRRAIDLYSAIDGDMTGEVFVKVVYADEDETEVIYKLVVSSEWKTLAASDITETEWAPGEISAKEGWKITTSSANVEANHTWRAFANDARGVKDGQNWHAAYVNGSSETTNEAGYYIDVDFGENPESYGGVRHLERINSDHWQKILILGSDDYESWTELYYTTDAEGNKTSVGVPVINGSSSGIADTYDFLFNGGEVNYRYLRIRIWNGLPTADEIRIIKGQTKVINTSLTLYKDPASTEESAFNFSMRENLTAENVEVKVDDSVIDAADYVLDKDNGTLTFTAGYLATLSGTYTVKFTVAGIESKATLTVKDRYSQSYLMAGTPVSNTTTQGDADVVLSINPDLFGSLANVVTDEETGVKTVAVTNILSERDDKKVITATVNEEAKTITVPRKAFRQSGDLYRDGAVISVAFEDGVVKNYTINTTATWNAIGTVKDNENIAAETEKWKDDEVVAKDTWQVRNNANWSTGWTAVNAFNKSTVTADGMGITSWHYNHGGDGTIIRYYFDVNFGEATTFAGIRYYARSSTRTTTDGETVWENAEWTAVRIYGSNDGVTWYLLKSHDIDAAKMYTGDAKLASVDTLKYRQADVIFDEAATYQYARIIVENTYADAAARHISFLDETAIKGSEPENPEKEVIIKADSTAGGTVTVNGSVSTGDTTVAKDEVVTLTATASSGSEFKYWIEVNTGKIISSTKDLTLSGAVGRKVRAVFAAPTGQRFVSFFGGIDGNNVVGSGYVADNESPKDAGIVPTALKAYVSGYTLAGWKLNVEDAAAVENIVSTDTTSTGFYAHYAKVGNTFTLATDPDVTVNFRAETGSVTGGNGSYTVDYGTRLTLVAADREGSDFSHWTYGGNIVSYEKSFNVSMPMDNITITPEYVAAGTAVEKEISVTLTFNANEAVNADGTKMAGFVITRYVPKSENIKAVDSGIIYVRDGAYADDLTLEKVGTTSVAPNGASKAVSVSLSNSAETGQYKFNARYEVETGITAIAFITYEVTDAEGKVSRATKYSDQAQIPNER